jgi:integrase
VVNQIFTFKASSSGINIPNPATGLRRKILPKGRRRPESPPDPFNEEQLKDFFNRAHKLANPDEFIVLSLMGRVGLRIGEAIAGERRDFFQEQKQFFVRQQYSDGTFKQPKHGIQRVVPVSKILLDRLNNHIAVARPGQEQLLCGKRSGELIQPFSRNRIRRLIEKICVEIGYKRRTSHDLRHSFAMTQILDGVSIKQLQEWLGHKDEVTTFVNYETLFSSRQGTLRDPCEV